MSETGNNGYVRWPDLTEAERRIKIDRQNELNALSKSMAASHETISLAIKRNADVIDGIDDRVDAIESTLDQLRGARSLITVLIGTNVLLVLVLVRDLIGGIV